MDLYKSTGHLTIEMVREARRALQQAILPDGTLLKIGQRIDVLPPPQNNGDTIFGESWKEYQAIIIDGILQWEATGKTIMDYWEPAHSLTPAGGNKAKGDKTG
jgi:hypothetical protein